MKFKFSITALLLAIGSIFYTGCKKDEAPAPEEPDHHEGTGSLRINMVPMFGDSLLELSNESYVTANGDTLTVNMFKFYVSNIVLTDNAGGTYEVPDSYYLINAANTASQTIAIYDIPGGHYTNITFLVGVDSARNVSGAQDGALDPSNGMFWTWSSGYIMAKLEGTSPQSNASLNAVTYHIGGFSGATSGLRTVSVPLTTNASVSSHGNPLVTITCDAAQWFSSPNIIDISTDSYTMMPGTLSVMIADNYMDMFTLTSVQN
jgi:hypothetical protein